METNNSMIVMEEHKAATREERFIFDRAQGLSFDKIVKKLGGSKSTWIKMEKELQLEIENAKKLVKDMTLSKLELTHTHMIKRLGVELSKIDDALKEQDYTEIKPEKLIELKFKLIEKVEKLNDTGNTEYLTDEEIELKKIQSQPNEANLIKAKLNAHFG